MYYQTLENFKETNGYELEDGWYPRVTSICSIKAKPALYRYYANLPDYKTAEAIMNKSAEEGTLVHDTVEAILRDKRPMIPNSIAPAINAFYDFTQKHKLVAHRIEDRVISRKHWYAGTMDILAEVDGRLGVLDIKTSTAIFRDYSIQTSAYIEALKEDPSLSELTRWILRIDQSQKCYKCGASLRVKGGNIKIRNGNTSCDHSWGKLEGEWELKELNNFDQDIKAFLASRDLWHWENSYFINQIRNQSK